MKLMNFKTGTLLLSAFALIALSGCGEEGTPSKYKLVGSTVVAPPVVIPAGKIAPVAVAKADPTTVTVGDTITLDGSSSSDEDGEIASYVWTVQDNVLGEEMILTTVTTDIPAGTYTVTLTVTDNDGLTGTDTVDVTIVDPAVNQPPVAVAKADPTTVTVGDTITLDGSSSSDEDGEIVSYVWKIQNDILGEEMILTATIPAGTYTITLTVTDNDNLTGTDTVDVTIVDPVVNQPPVANAGLDQNMTVSKVDASQITVILDGSNSSDDGLIQSLSYQWETVAKEASANGYHDLSLSDPTSEQPTFTVSCEEFDWAQENCDGQFNDQDGEYVCASKFSLTVSDGQFTSTDTVTVFVNYDECRLTAEEQEVQCLLDAGGYESIIVNGRTWLDRNLGASHVAVDANDTLAFGDLYQWGRAADGHEDRGSITLAGIADTITPDNASFLIYGGSSPYDWTSIDTDGALRAAAWSTPYDSTTNPNQVCPCGYVVPSVDDFNRLLLSGEIATLNLPLAGFRGRSLGNIFKEGIQSFFWTSDTVGHPSIQLSYRFSPQSGVPLHSWTPNEGDSVRCIKPSP